VSKRDLAHDEQTEAEALALALSIRSRAAAQRLEW